MNNDWGNKRGNIKLTIVVMLLVAAVILLRIGMNRSTALSRAARAQSEIRGAELALCRLMSETRVNDLRDIFADPATLFKPTVKETIEAQTAVCYDLLLHGKNAGIALKSQVRAKLGPSYMDLPKDPWGRPYQFYFGPLSGSVNTYFFRCYRGENYVYDLTTYNEETKVMRGNPKPDPDTPPAKGYPCAGDLPIYIFSCGRNGQSDQLPWGGNGGDDINNWDSASGWSALY